MAGFHAPKGEHTLNRTTRKVAGGTLGVLVLALALAPVAANATLVPRTVYAEEFGFTT
jgi:hypothetical protein